MSAQEGQFPKAAPDEGSYETTAPWPTELRVFKEEGRMEIEFSDGVTHSLPAEYLRVESPSAEVQGHGPSQKKIVSGRRHVKIAAVEPVGHYAIRIVFDDRHDSGIYSWSYLRELGDSYAEKWAAYQAAHLRTKSPLFEVPMKIAIAGAGIGGLTAAMCLHRAGFDVEVFEAVSELRPLGVGINIQAGAVRILSGLGLQPALAATAIETRELRYANRHGQTIWADPRGRHAGLPWPQFSIHRGELQMILYRAAERMLGAGRIKFGRRIASFEQKGSKVIARFADRDGAIVETTEADILIGADGIHSAVRAHYHPDEGPPKWQGILMWRGVTVGKPYLGGNTMVQAGHHNQKFVCYPISRAHAEKGEALINWICDLHMGDDAMLPREDWNRPGKLADFLPRFEDWNFGWLDVPGVIRAAHAIFEFPMVDRDPLPGWSHGRITLLGDAAHPMYPIGSNGASQAILDGEAITQELSAGSDPEAALKRYERRRLPPTAAIVESNRRKGIDVMLDLVEQRAPQGFADLESVLPSDELERIVGDYKKLAAQDRETLLKLASAQ